VGQGYGKVSWSVRAIWENYAGWFHHTSTTELYDIPRSAIDHDLIDLAGGTGALVDRAKQMIGEGRLPQAIHLLDIVMTEKPDDPEAVASSIEAHERLLAASVNFWLSSWLRHQIDVLRAR
jgi:alkyl sulfatase BDS1-like metallo-beta-lactamase superfamily hydrolase